MSMIGIVKVPHSFEGLKATVGNAALAQVLIDVPADTEAAKTAIVEVKASAQGKLKFLIGESGSGKTSFLEALPFLLSQEVGATITTPGNFDLPLRDLPAWISREIEAKRRVQPDKVILINIDGRESVPLESKETQGVIHDLNALLRRKPNILAFWPSTDQRFVDDAIRHLGEVGGTTALSKSPIQKITGLQASQYIDALELILTATGVRLEDAALTRTDLEPLVKTSKNIGQFMIGVHGITTERYDIGTLGQKLPKVMFVVSSAGDASMMCRMLTRGRSFLIDPDRLLQNSRANVADDWRKRGAANPKHALPFISSLFEARLTYLSASSVVNCCALYTADPDLSTLARTHYPNPVPMNAGNALKSSGLYRALVKKEDVSGSASSGSAQILKSYGLIQEQSKKKHKSINSAILHVLGGLEGVALSNLKVEHRPVSGQGLQVDCWFEGADRPQSIEFTHRTTGQDSAAVISSYVLEKLQDYARDYALI